MADSVWFWQRIVSTHMAGVAEALAVQGRPVTFVAEQSMSTERAAQGWQAPALRQARLNLTPNADSVKKLVTEVPANSIHICQGLRGNGLINVARNELARRGLRQWVIMETVEDCGWRGMLRRLEYRRLVRRWHNEIEGILAIGHATQDWLTERGMPTERIFPFAYFLPDTSLTRVTRFDAEAPFRFLFVGRLVELKRADLLFDALAGLADRSFELVMVGAGPLEEKLRAVAQEKLPGRVYWLGGQPAEKIPLLMAEADCLVLPSRYDGWGAVVSEALMAGTPAVCSDACGSATAVRASGYGGIFSAGDLQALHKLLVEALDKGRQTPDERVRLAAWAGCLGATTGASYLDAILRDRDKRKITPPWKLAREDRH